MTNSGGNQRNNTIDILRYFCAILVVAIHATPFKESCYGLYYVLTQFLARIGVPFFFAVSGYFFFRKLEKGTLNFPAYLWGLLRKYLLWSCIYYGVAFLEGGFARIPAFLKECVVNFLIHGSSSHFWFFPALVFSSCMVLLLYRLGMGRAMIPLSLILFAVGCMGCAYSGLFVGSPTLTALFESETFQVIRRFLLTGVPFFVCGYIVGILRNHPPGFLAGRNCIRMLAAAVGLWIGEFLMLHILHWNGHMSISLGLYPVVVMMLLAALQYPLPTWSKQSEQCRVLAGFTYCAHPLLFSFLKEICKDVFGFALAGFPLFLATVLVTWVVSMLIWKWNNRYLNYFAL